MFSASGMLYLGYNPSKIHLKGASLIPFLWIRLHASLAEYGATECEFWGVFYLTLSAF